MTKHDRSFFTTLQSKRELLKPPGPGSGMRSGQTAAAEILPAGEFWEAEECHQQYYEKCGRGYCISENYRE